MNLRTIGVQLTYEIYPSFSYCKVASSRLSRLVAHLRIFRLFVMGKIDAYVHTVTFGQKSSKLKSRPVYCSRLYDISHDKVELREDFIGQLVFNQPKNLTTHFGLIYKTLHQFHLK